MTRMLTPTCINNSLVLSNIWSTLGQISALRSIPSVSLWWQPKRVHWTTMRHILRYVHDTIEHGLRYTWGDDVKLCGFTDADWAGSSVDQKSTSGYCFSVGSRMISWCSRKQKSVALSSIVLIWGSIGCALAMKIGGEAKAHELSPRPRNGLGRF